MIYLDMNKDFPNMSSNLKENIRQGIYSLFKGVLEWDEFKEKYILEVPKSNSSNSRMYVFEDDGNLLWSEDEIKYKRICSCTFKGSSLEKKTLLQLCEEGNKINEAPLYKRFLKLGEEVGEVSNALQKVLKFSTSEYKIKDGDDPNQQLKEECVDCLLCIGSILSQIDTTEEELDIMLTTKQKKWIKIATKEE